ncbi:MAG: hypothetical protein JXR70_09075 [Spirochaetales bacterium]|nr:hypothetical protein [Spirochaetales bacterium]
MKKIVIFVFILVLGFAAYADQYMGFGGAAGFTSTKFENSGSNYSIDLTTGAFNFCGIYGQDFYFFTDMNLGFPLSGSISENNQKTPLDFKNYSMSLVLDVIMGIGSFIPVLKEMPLFIGGGLHYFSLMLMGNYDYDVSSLSMMVIGAGATCGILIPISRSTSVRIALNAAYDFYNFIPTFVEDFTNSISIFPSIDLMMQINNPAGQSNYNSFGGR